MFLPLCNEWEFEDALTVSAGVRRLVDVVVPVGRAASGPGHDPPPCSGCDVR